MIEIISARKYYGRYATGTVVLINGCPHHFTGSGNTRDARAFARQYEEFYIRTPMNPNRFASALASVNNPAPDLLVLTEILHVAVVEACVYEKDPYTDPAVLLLSMQLAFITHADFATPNLYDKLIASCEANAIQPRIDPKEIH